MNHRTQNVSFKIEKKPDIKPNLQTAPIQLDGPVTDEIKNQFNSQLNTIDLAPTPYIFRISGTNKNISTRNAKSPPFYLLLDHIIAVLWHIFAPEENKTKLGISQLEWALYFLKGIVDPLKQERSLDVDIAIQTIEDCLLDCYANLANVVTSRSMKKISPSTNREIYNPPETINPDNDVTLEQIEHNFQVENYIRMELIKLRELAAELISPDQSVSETCA